MNILPNYTYKINTRSRDHTCMPQVYLATHYSRATTEMVYREAFPQMKIVIVQVFSTNTDYEVC